MLFSNDARMEKNMVVAVTFWVSSCLPLYKDYQERSNCSLLPFSSRARVELGRKIREANNLLVLPSLENHSEISSHCAHHKYGQKLLLSIGTVKVQQAFSIEQDSFIKLDMVMQPHLTDAIFDHKVDAALDLQGTLIRIRMPKFMEFQYIKDLSLSKIHGNQKGNPLVQHLQVIHCKGANLQDVGLNLAEPQMVMKSSINYKSLI
ncbi:hypothetical protein VNO77_20199 [Canavalia gladiata]|uniref:Uncharacterized protein n=1 Tax=Canavalia gladiata TaxID=3824 RepID=A0AAN9QL82_CANGL